MRLLRYFLTMAREWIEWLEIAQPTLKQAQEADDAGDAASKRCPQCGWLDHVSVAECFRCGYNYLSDDFSAEAGGLFRIGMPAPDIQATAFEEWKLFGHRAGRDPLAEYALRLQSEHFRLVCGFDTLISLNALNIIHYEHQLRAALTALNSMRGQALLADEVGLGKTIEAGIIMKELILRGLVKRILIMTPASLMMQWQEELAAKFGEAFVIATQDEDWRQDKVITSISRLRLPKKTGKADASAADAQETEELAGARQILRQEYDLIIIDEAHKLKHRATQRFKFVSRIRKKYMLMLTATPVHNDLTELYNLVTILKPGLLGTIRSFKRHFVASSDARRPKNEQHLKTLLASVMIRNRRTDVNIRFPLRKSAIYHLALTDKEQRLYDDVSAYIRQEFKTQTRHEFHLLSLTLLQKELCSSAWAVKATLERIAAREHYPDDTRARLHAFIALAGDIEDNRKMEAFLEILAKFPGKFLVFTEFLQTMTYIKEHLDRAGISAQEFHGGLDLAQRREAVRNFEQSARVMISTQTGGEGVNLQFCHQLVNFDLPWNPMMIEQRIGRLHRLGQQEDVAIFNFSMHNTIEAHVLDLLSRKIRMFELVVGELDLILSEVEDHKTFEHAIQDIWLTSKDDDEMREKFDRFGDRLTNARKTFEKVKEAERLTSELFEV